MNIDTAALIQMLADKSGQDPDEILALLEALADTLMDLPVGARAKTPLGVFEKKIRKAKRMTSVNSGAEVVSREKEAVVLRASKKMVRTLTSSRRV